MRARDYRRALFSIIGAVALTLLSEAASAATKLIDLDGNGVAESAVDLNILSTYPAKIEVKVTNRSVGNAYTFKDLSAGPGGFTSNVGIGTTTGVGSKWTWQTGSTIYSFVGSTCAKDICFTKTAGTGRTAAGPFGVPGRSLIPSDITVSSTSLTSSLITFFSPLKVVFEITSSASPGGFKETLTNTNAPGGPSVTVNTEEYPPGCCPADPELSHQLKCSGVCGIDYLHDPSNCGACGNVCGVGTCCANGNCVSLCPAGRTFCNGLCYDLQNDPNHCGSCTNVCNSTSICVAGACTPCSGQGGAQFACDNRCVNLNTNPYNCGACGHSCNEACPSDFSGVCSNGQSCRCVAGTPAPQPPSNIPPPIPPLCPDPGPPPPPVIEPPICMILAESNTIDAGISLPLCRGAGMLFKEVPSKISLCSDYVPGQTGTCASGAEYAEGTYMRLVPTGQSPGDAFPTLYGVHVIADTSNDGMMQAGETANLVLTVLNAGSKPITNVSGKLTSPAVDLTDDGVNNAVNMTFVADTAPFPNLPGTPPAADCVEGSVYPVSNTLPFQIRIPSNHPADVSRPFVLTLTGKVDGNNVTLPMNLALGIASKCDPLVDKSSYDSVDGLLSPMAKLVPEGDDPPFPSKPFQAGNSRPLKLRQLCGGVNLTGGDIVAPEIVGLTRNGQPLDIRQLNLNDDSSNSNDPFFRFNTSTKQWSYSMRTSLIDKGTFVLKVRLAGRKDYVTGFVLN